MCRCADFSKETTMSKIEDVKRDMNIQHEIKLVDMVLAHIRGKAIDEIKSKREIPTCPIQFAAAVSYEVGKAIEGAYEMTYCGADDKKLLNHIGNAIVTAVGLFAYSSHLRPARTSIKLDVDGYKKHE